MVELYFVSAVLWDFNWEIVSSYIVLFLFVWFVECPDFGAFARRRKL
jgi:hypothetical protein